MDVIFNELSESIQASDAKEADSWLQNLFLVTIKLEKRLYKTIYVRSNTNLSASFISPNYTFGQWLYEVKDRDLQRKVISQLTSKPLLSTSSAYYYKSNQCHGLGIAHSNNIFSISYPKSVWTIIIQIEKEIITPKGAQRTIVDVKNISSTEDIEHYFPTVVFEHHKKHDNRRRNLRDGESTLHYCIPEETQTVQKLLDCSFGDSKMYNWDEEKKMYIEFQCHLNNKWHGYHIVDSNRVPNKIKNIIDDFRSK